MRRWIKLSKSFYFLLFFVVACSKDKGTQTSFDSTACSSTGKITADCVVDNSNSSSYYYNEEYGGRNPEITGNITIPDDQGIYTLPKGWYNNVTLTYSSAYLNAINASKVKNASTVFTLPGTMITSAAPACNPNGLQSSSCSASQDHFIFSTPFGGRGANCTNYNNGLTNGPCWVSNTGYYIDSNSTNPVDCTVTGQQAAMCSAIPTTYFYTNEYGGRGNNCVTGLNANACWATAGKYLTANADICVDNSLNANSCSTQPGRYVYTDSYGGRGANCTNDINGLCFVTQATKSVLEPTLQATNIKSGISIFGITGTYSGINDWYSMAHRDQDTSPMILNTEVVIHAGSSTNPYLPGGYRAITSIAKDDEGLFSTEVTQVNRTGWNSLSCGMAQATLADRITHCAAVFGANATWDGSIYGNAGQSRWVLVSRTAAMSSGMGREVWRDEKTGLLWSSLVSKSINWCKSSGSSNNSSVNASYRENDVSNFCNNQTYQNNSTGLAISACFEDTGFSSTDADIDNLGKAGLNIASTPAVAWRLPTFYDYEIADTHGIRFVFPDMGVNSLGDEWMATIYSSDKQFSWMYNSGSGIATPRARNQKAMVRCVGR